VRKYSPESPIQLVTDKSLDLCDKYVVLSNIIGLPILVRDKPCSYIDRSDKFEINLPKMQEWFDRMYTVCGMLDTKWVVRLEDDVHMRRPILEFPTTPAAGNDKDYGMGGGSIFDREIFMRIYEEDGVEYVNKKCVADNNRAWAGDGLLRQMFTDHNHEYSKWIEITEDWQENNKDTAFHHGDKSLYNKDYLKLRGL
jgi:hypothetical protein